MKTLDYRTSKTLESTKIQLENGCNNVEQVIFFSIRETYNYFTDGSVEVFKKDYIKQDDRETTNISEDYREYNTEKGYRDAIKRWSKHGVTVQVQKN